MASQHSAAPLGGRYKQGVPAIDLYIERDTERVPADHRYHVVERGVVVASYRTLRAAQRRYHERLLAANYTPAPAEQVSAEERLRTENLERDLLRSASYWAESYRYGGGGGRLRHR